MYKENDSDNRSEMKQVLIIRSTVTNKPLNYFIFPASYY